MSTIDYYRELNKLTNRRSQDNINPPLYLANLNQKEIHDLQKLGRWGEIAEILIEKCKELESIGCEGLAFCANTPHRVYDIVQRELDTEILHIANSIGRFLQDNGYQKIGFLGTQYTMEGHFIKGAIQDQYSIEVLTPTEKSRSEIQSLLYEEMSHGLFSENTQKYFLSIISDFKTAGADAVVLSCTEFPILLDGKQTSLPTVDSAMCHINDIAEFILSA